MSKNLVGQTLDGKYKIESEIGKGGMGTVYLATHIGTERPVAVKVIAPQFMQKREFVERFRREARAAGRLRHPNVVNVTDFGFSETEQGRAAYLAMEYLDGCTLGEILDEEKHLPLPWSLDILEQVCSAVQEAHTQGIIHRDLKPDNIWLEPDQRGGYTVKVLDFGIAKLETESSDNFQNQIISDVKSPIAGQTQPLQESSTVPDVSQTPTVNFDGGNSTVMSEKQTRIEANNSKSLAAEAGTMIQPPEFDGESGTAIFPSAETQIAESENQGTKILSTQIEIANSALQNKSTAELTRVGAVLGTPLYMSPEQCRGDKLHASSDIYSLGVIAYQMLSGNPPFVGEFTQVMDAHKSILPPPINTKKIPGTVKEVVLSALAKNPEDRPQSAEAFASKLRAQSESVWTLMSRAATIYSENLVKFLFLAFVIYFPMMLLFLIQTVFALLMEGGIIREVPYLRGAISVIFSLSGFFSGTILSGIMTWLVAQKMAVPMRPLKLRPAFKAVRKRFKSLLRTAAFSSIAGLIGLSLCLVPGIVMWVCWALVTPVVMMEGLGGRKAFARSYQLVKRNLKTTVALMMLTFVLGAFAGIFANFLSKGIIGNSLNTESSPTTISSENDSKNNENFTINIGGVKIVKKPDENETESQQREKRLKGTIRENAYAMIQIPFSFVIGSFFAVALALLYIKTRLAGGESMSDLLEQFEETEQPRKKWQERVRGRLLQSGRNTSKP